MNDTSYFTNNCEDNHETIVRLLLTFTISLNQAQTFSSILQSAYSKPKALYRTYGISQVQ